MSETAKSADRQALKAQRMYQQLVGLEQVFLVLAAAGSVVTVVRGENTVVQDGVLVALFLAVAARSLRNLSKSDQMWYNSRALAEGIQSQIWRYVMGAKPYGPAAGGTATPPTRTPEMQLADNCRALRASSGISLPLPSGGESVEQITSAMKHLHDAGVQERVAVYARDRLTDQRTYYQRKSTRYRALSRNWNIAIFVIEAIAVVASAGKFIGLPSISLFGVAGTAVAGIAAWTQMKQFKTLERRYSQMVRNLQEYLDILSVATDPATLSPDGLSDLVDQVEQLLEHEHGSWLLLYQGLHAQQPQQANLPVVAQQLTPSVTPGMTPVQRP